MSRRLARRLAAIVLFAAFVVGGGGTSLLDVVLFHSGAVQHATVPDAGRTTHHACVLSSALPTSLPARIASMPLAAAPRAVVPAVRLAETPLASASVRSPQQPRAPPTALI